MNRNWSTAAAVVLGFLGFGVIAAQAATIDELVNQLTQSLTEDLRRQQVESQRRDAEEVRQSQPPDLSEFGTPVETEDMPIPPIRHRSSNCAAVADRDAANCN